MIRGICKYLQLIKKLHCYTSLGESANGKITYLADKIKICQMKMPEFCQIGSRYLKCLKSDTVIWDHPLMMPIKYEESPIITLRESYFLPACHASPSYNQIFTMYDES